MTRRGKQKPMTMTMTQHEGVGQTTEAPDQSGASSIPDGDLKALIQDMSAQIADLKREVQQAKAMTPAYKPMERTDPHNAAQRRAQIEQIGVTKKGDAEFSDGLNAFVPVTSGFGFEGVRGNRIPDAMIGSLNKRFDVGDLVRINPDATREGSTRSWGEILDKHNADGVGVVTAVSDFRKCGMWKYRVRLTKVGGFRGLDGFYDYELLPA